MDVLEAPLVVSLLLTLLALFSFLFTVVARAEANYFHPVFGQTQSTAHGGRSGSAWSDWEHVVLSWAFAASSPTWGGLSNSACWLLGALA